MKSRKTFSDCRCGLVHWSGTNGGGHSTDSEFLLQVLHMLNVCLHCPRPRASQGRIVILSFCNPFAKGLVQSYEGSIKPA